jgi:hypothetical protein
MTKMASQEQDRLLTRMAQRLSETRAHWLFRPDLRHLLDALQRAEKQGAIAGCFILSNNGSARLVELVRRMLNCYTGSATDPTRGLFKAGWHRGARCRGGRTTKTWEQVVACLKSAGLPPPLHVRDLLFYDDLVHVMAKEIPHYVQVPPYFHVTPTALVFRDLKPVFQQEGISAERIAEVVKSAETAEEQDMAEDRQLKMRPPTPAETAGDMGVFMSGFQRFLSATKTAKKATTKTKRATRRHTPTSPTSLTHTKKSTRRAARTNLWRRY